ncbi:unnamed protein product [Mycena citricolor]|uniref:Uncharacterized protein n=1 Tax=Mycena citricolor TaxID=2018698 RepID=A0AAD2HQ28_9AGAR|nr:unnamed protein product [Mycena citricolor]
MPEYVYALHDFTPEHEDEVSFRIGERIEVIEKDDLYSDGWWRGRNLAGREGLFPQSYTTSAEPQTEASPTPASTIISPAPTETISAPLQSLAEEPESVSVSPVLHTPQVQLNGQGADEAVDGADTNGEVMKATMTDVQKAIEQLGSRTRDSSMNLDHDARSFSFASTRDNLTTDDEEEETDYDMSEGEGQGWHKGARRKLAEKARQAVAEAEKLEALSAGPSRIVVPPISVELSDESDVEDDEDGGETFSEDNFNSPVRDHPYIPEEDEPSESVDGLGRMRVAEDIPATATVSTFQLPTEVPPSPVSPVSPTLPELVAPTPIVAPVVAAVEPERMHTPARDTFGMVSPGLPSPALSAGAAAVGSKHSSLASTSAAGLAVGIPSKPSSVGSAPLSAQSENKRHDDSGNASASSTSKHPSEWTVDEVVDWLKSKGFDEDVCDKFTEQEITGDVLIELDVNLLKTEIGIMAFGKRMRIANAIVDLRRPPSPSASFQMPPNFQQQNMPQYAMVYTNSQSSQQFPGSAPHNGSPQYNSSPHHVGHSRSQSQSHSQKSYNAHHSLQSSVGSPLQNGYLAQTYGVSHGLGEVSGLPAEGAPIGLGIPLDQINGSRSKGRPAQLMLSPSDGALNVSATQAADGETQEDERAVMSESELPAPNTSSKKKFFGTGGRSPLASPISSTHVDKTEKEGSVNSKDAESAADVKSDSGKGTVKKKASTVRHSRGKKSIDGNAKSNDRLSIFGTSFGPTLGRKPAPRYSGAADEEKTEKPDKTEKPADKAGSGFTLPRLARKSGRPSTPGGGVSGGGVTSQTPSADGLPPQPTSPKDGSSPTLLRKRTASNHATDSTKAASIATKVNATGAEPGAAAGVTKLKPGMSIIEQIGASDHSGWMRKKSERYNSWKLRYFVLKGSDLYCLRSSNKAETKIKGYVNIVGYKVTVDETINPGKYGFRIDHDHDKTHYFSSDEKTIVRDWMKAIMKATIGRDYSKPVVSSCNIPTIPLIVAQTMNPAPRPPSPTARAATQRALRRENTDQPSTRDARVLMLTGFATAESAPKEERTRLESFFTNETTESGTGSAPGTPMSSAPPRPSRRLSQQTTAAAPVDEGLIEWANGHLPSNLRIMDTAGPLCDGLGLMRIAESIKGRPNSPPVLDSAFPKGPTDDNLDGLFKLFDFLLDNEVRMGSVSINDVRQGKRDKIVQLLRGLKAWEEKRRALANSIGRGSGQAGSFMAPA